jgi:glutathione S-transferase
MYALVIGNKAYSSWSLRPWLLMKHAGIAFEEVKLSLYQEGARQVLLSHSGAGKVPVLHDGDLTIWDSLAIAEYLAERHPDRRLWPADANARAQARSVAAEMHSGFANLRSQMPMNVRRRIARQPGAEVADEIARIQSMWADCRKRFGAGGPFLFGAFSIADAMYAPVASRFHTYGVQLAEPARAYAQTLLELPAYRQWVADAHAESEVNPLYEA